MNAGPEFYEKEVFIFNFIREKIHILYVKAVNISKNRPIENDVWLYVVEDQKILEVQNILEKGWVFIIS